MGKIVTISEVEKITEQLRQDKKIIVHCHGVFDVLHLGHIKHFEAAKIFGDVLIVTVTPDIYVNKGYNRPIFNEYIRAETVASLKCVDFVVINEWRTAYETIKLIKPDYHVKGNDYSSITDERLQRDKEAIESVGGQLKFTNEMVLSSSNIIKQYYYSKEVLEFINKFKEKYTYSYLVNLMNSLQNINTLIIGDYIIDEYCWGRSIGKSGKSPIVAFETDKTNVYRGGSLVIYSHLNNYLNVSLLYDSKCTIKRRYIENNQKLFETYSYKSTCEDDYEGRKVVYDCDLSKFDLVLVADFGHGLIDKELRDKIKKTAKFLVVNTQRNAGNMGFNTIRKYWDRKNDIFICIDEEELKLAVHEKYDHNVDIKEIIKKENLDNCLITGGERGCIIGGASIPPFATNIVDTIGAGDALLSLIAPLSYVKAPLEVIGFIGNVAGAIACSYYCNAENITKDKLYSTIKGLLA